MLLVAQPDVSLPVVEGELVQPLDTQAVNLISEDATATAVVKGCQHHLRVTTLEDGKTFRSSFELLVSELLTLLDVAQFRSLPVEFTFFLDSYAAALSEVILADEELHLVAPPHSGIHSAVMQYSGFRSVVGDNICDVRHRQTRPRQAFLLVVALGKGVSDIIVPEINEIV